MMKKFGNQDLMPGTAAGRTQLIGVLGKVLGALLSLLVLLTLLAKFVPWSPTMPGPGLDPAWRFGVNQAVAQGLVFGKDLVFTFGPYGAIYTLVYGPATDLLAMAGSIYLAISYWGIYTMLMRNRNWHHTVLFCMVLACVLYTRDPLFFSLPLIVALLSYKIMFTPGHFVRQSRFGWLVVAAVFAPLGLLPLIKGSLWLLSAVTIALCGGIFIHGKQRRLAVASILAPLLLLPLAWAVSGQPLLALPGYFISQSAIVAGYTEAMASGRNYAEVAVYLLPAALLLAVVALQAGATRIQRLFLVAVYFFYLFMVFKAGFTRQDGHTTIASTALLFGVFFLGHVVQTRLSSLLLMAAMFCWVMIDSVYIKSSTASLYNARDAYVWSWDGAKRRWHDRNWPRSDYDIAVAKMRAEAALPLLPGRTDTYPTEISFLIASGNTWAPRPVFQSYSVYTPSLAEKNRQYLLGTTAPDNLVFEAGSLDERFPTLDDGASWPVLLNNYVPSQKAGNALILKKKPDAAPLRAPTEVLRASYKLGQRIALPDSQRQLFANFDIKPTLRGRLAGVLLKPEPLYITVTLKNGSQSRFTVIPNMARSGFLLSPLVRNTAEFGLLYGRPGALAANQVASLVIDTGDGKHAHWQEQFQLVLSELPPQQAIDVSPMGLLSAFDPALGSTATPTAASCQGSIDQVNSAAPGALVQTAGSIKVDGWLAGPSGQTSRSDKVYIVLSDAKGEHHFAQVKRTPRPDVATYLKQAALADAGYTVNADTSAFKGRFQLGLAVEHGGRIERCPQFSVAVEIAQ